MRKEQIEFEWRCCDDGYEWLPAADSDDKVLVPVSEELEVYSPTAHVDPRLLRRKGGRPVRRPEAPWSTFAHLGSPDDIAGFAYLWGWLGLPTVAGLRSGAVEVPVSGADDATLLAEAPKVDIYGRPIDPADITVPIVVRTPSGEKTVPFTVVEEVVVTRRVRPDPLLLAPVRVPGESLSAWRQEIDDMRRAVDLHLAGKQRQFERALDDKLRTLGVSIGLARGDVSVRPGSLVTWLWLGLAVDTRDRRYVRRTCAYCQRVFTFVPAGRRAEKRFCDDICKGMFGKAYKNLRDGRWTRAEVAARLKVSPREVAKLMPTRRRRPPVR